MPCQVPVLKIASTTALVSERMLPHKKMREAFFAADSIFQPALLSHYHTLLQPTAKAIRLLVF